MLARAFDARRFLREVYGTGVFLEYCESRGIAFEQIPGWLMRDDDLPRWREAFGNLPETEQARVELELAQAAELADEVALGQLLAASADDGPPPDSVPGGAALALWFLLHRPEMFRDAFVGHEIAEVGAWRSARAPPGVTLNDLAARAAALAESLRGYFRTYEGVGRFCAAEVYRLDPPAYCFVTRLSDRLRLFEGFTERGQRMLRRAWPAFAVIYVYYPADGRLLLKARQRSAESVFDLFRRFGRAVLDVELAADCVAPVFRLDLFKLRFDPLPGSAGVESVRVKAVHLVYPGWAGRRRVKLETLSGDDQFAILQLLREHGGQSWILDQLEVVYAELEVKLRNEAGRKTVLVRLWPDRSNLNHSALGSLLYACLRRWGVAHAA